MQITNIFRKQFNVGLIALAVAVCVVLLPRMAPAEIFSGFPDVIVCTPQKWKIVFYVDRQDDDGVVWYRTMERQVSQIDKQGIFRRKNGPDCNGKSVEQLRKEGKAFDVVR